MSILKPIYFASVLVLALLSTARAQESTTAQKSSLTITAAAAGEQVRITAPSSVVQMHVEIYAASGEKLFDQEIRGGNVFDWHLQNGQAQRLAPGNYVCVVTAKSVSGRLTQKIGTVSVAENSAVVQPAESPQLSAAQAQTIGPVEENSSWTIAAKDEVQTPTVIANDGTDGQMIRGRGALTFRIGNFFSGIDTEQMRLTEDGRLGIGTSTPQSKLDVAGAIRAERFLVVKPNFSKGDKAPTDGQTTDAVGSVQPLIAGTGTLNHIAKWTPDGSTLGDSGIFETAGGLVGIGTVTPSQSLEVANGRILTSGSQTLAAPGGILEIGATVTNNDNQASGIRMRNLFNGSATNQQALDVAPTFAPSASIALARGFLSAAFFAPPSGVTITDAYGGNGGMVYSNTSGAVTNGTVFAIRSPIVQGSLKPTTQYGLHILNQGIGGTNNSYGLFVDAQSGSTNSYSAIFAGGNVGVGTSTPAVKLDVAGDVNTSTKYMIGGFHALSVTGDGANANSNAFAGVGAGTANTPSSTQILGNMNSFFGNNAGHANTTGASNSFFGNSAGQSTTTGQNNSFFGVGAGFFNTMGINNSSFGAGAGQTNTTGSGDTYLGAFSNSADGLSNATAIGNGAYVTQSNSIVLGSINGQNFQFANTNVGIGTTAPTARLHVVGDGLFNGNLTVTGALTATLPAGSFNYIQNGTSPQASSNFNISGTGTANNFSATGAVSGASASFTGNVNTSTQYNIGGSRVLSVAGTSNTFAGVGAGTSNTGQQNAFFGAGAGAGNTTGPSNAFFGFNAGAGNSAGNNNAYFGAGAGTNTGGSGNAFFGASAGFSSGNENNNTFIGNSTNGAEAITNATALGSNARVTQSNSLVLGSINGVNSATSNTNVGIGTTAPSSVFHIVSQAEQLITASTNWTGGAWFNLADTDTGGRTWNLISTASANSEGAGKLLVRDATGGGAVRMAFDTAGNVGIGATGPLDKLQVAGDIRVGTGTTGCVKDADGTVLTGTCSSDVRFKRNITPFPKLLDRLVRLQPVNFYWRASEYPKKGFGSSQSFGLVAQDVEQVLPELVTEDEQGFKAVRYNKLPLLTLQGLKELKADNDSLRRENEALKHRIEAQEIRLRKLEAKLDQ